MEMIQVDLVWCVHYDGVLSICQVDAEASVYDEDIVFDAYEDAVEYVKEEHPAWAEYLKL